MSSVTELHDTYLGAARGFGGISNTSRRFRVVIDAYTDDPSTVVQTSVPLGSTYPLSSFPAIAYQYRIESRLDYLSYIVAVDYRPIETAINAGWVWSLNGFLDSVTVFETVENPPGFTKIIGSPVYRIAYAPGDTATHFASTASGTIVNLVATSARKPDPQGHNVPKPGFSFYFKRSFDTVTITQCGTAGTYLGKVNDQTFQGEMTVIGSVLFSELVVVQVPGLLDNQSSPTQGYHFDVQLRFDFNPEKFSPIRREHRLIDEDGNESRVLKVQNGQVQTETFDVIYGRNLNDVFAIFG